MKHIPTDIPDLTHQHPLPGETPDTCPKCGALNNIPHNRWRLFCWPCWNSFSDHGKIYNTYLYYSEDGALLRLVKKALEG